MSFVRPEASAQLVRWREAIAGAILACLGGYWTMAGHGVMPYLGAALLVLAGALIIVGVQRARIRLPGRGPGIVQVTEDQIAYLGPLSGGAVALSDITRLAVDKSGHPAHWIISQAEQPDLYVPVTAAGSEALFDIFARLPGLPPGRVVAALQDTRNAGGQARVTVVLWQREADRPALNRVH